MLASMIRQRLFSISFSLLIALTPAFQGCKAPRAFGDRNSLIVLADSALWSSVDSAFMAALERTVYTTRPERTFKVTFVAANDTLWRNFRLWQQVAVLGSGDDPLSQRVLGASQDPDARPPAIVQADDIWARGQTVTLLLLPDADAAKALRSLLPDLYMLLDEQYGEWVLQRMYASGVNDSLSEALSAIGFTLQLPKVYRSSQTDAFFRFRNANPSPGTLLRSVLVTWQPGIDAEAPAPASLRAWRESIGETQYTPQQTLLADGVRFDTIDVAGLSAIEMRGVWQDRSDFPAAGPLIARAVVCPDQNRTYLLDAWLYAPGTDKHPYVRQLEVILNSFRCSTGAEAVAAVGESAASLQHQAAG